MVPRPGPRRSVSEALCPDCVFPYSQAPGRGLRTLAQTPPQPGGGLLERVCPVGPFSIVPRRLAGGLVPRLPGGDVTEKRSLRDVGTAGRASLRGVFCRVVLNKWVCGGNLEPKTPGDSLGRAHAGQPPGPLPALCAQRHRRLRPSQPCLPSSRPIDGGHATPTMRLGRGYGTRASPAGPAHAKPRRL